MVIEVLNLPTMEFNTVFTDSIFKPPDNILT